MKYQKLILAVVTAAIAAPVATGKPTAGGANSRPVASEIRPVASEISAGLTGSPAKTQAAAGSSRPVASEISLGLSNSPSLEATSQSLPAAKVADGFDWNDAGIGAGVTLASALAAASILTLRRRTTLAH